MAKKRGSEREREARERMKEQFDAELRACEKYFAVLDRRDVLLGELDHEHDLAVAEVADIAGVDRTAEMLTLSKSKVRDACKSTQDSGDGRAINVAQVA